MNSREMPHAAMNLLMQWVRLQGEQVDSFQTWPLMKGWSTLPEWTVHLEMHSAKTVHVRIKPKGYRFTVTAELDMPSCPRCAARRSVAQTVWEAAQATPLPPLAAPSAEVFMYDE